MVLKVENVTAGYTQTPVLHHISFSVQSGEICGLIGLNGAGKSTTIKHVVGLMPVFSGNISVQGKELKENAKAYRTSIAVIPETPVLYEELTLREHLEITAKAYGQDTKETMERALALVEKFRLTKELEWFPAYFSKGMKQKVLIICALMLDVPLYVVDEPFLGLDPLGIRTLLECLEEKKKQGAAILMSTHVLDTAEKVCDTFVVLHEGHIRAKGTLESLQQQLDEQGVSLNDIYFSLTEVGDVHE